MIPTLRTAALVTTALVAALPLSACGSSAPDVDLSAACAETSTAADVPVCTRLYETGVPLRLPTSSEAALGAVARGGAEFVTSDGGHLRLSETVRDQVAKDEAYATTVYRASTDAGTVTAVSPVLTVPEGVLLARVLGGAVLTGTISAYAADDEYEQRPSLPIVLTLDAAASDDGRLRGSVANADRSVALTGGACVPALLTAGARDPLRGAFTSRIDVSRVPSMHAEFDDELVLAWDASASGMGVGFFPSVATVMDADPLARTWEVEQHGGPTSGPALRLEKSGSSVDPGARC